MHIDPAFVGATKHVDSDATIFSASILVLITPSSGSIYSYQIKVPLTPRAISRLPCPRASVTDSACATRSTHNHRAGRNLPTSRAQSAGSGSSVALKNIGLTGFATSKNVLHPIVTHSQELPSTARRLKYGCSLIPIAANSIA